MPHKYMNREHGGPSRFRRNSCALLFSSFKPLVHTPSALLSVGPWALGVWSGIAVPFVVELCLDTYSLHFGQL